MEQTSNPRGGASGGSANSLLAPKNLDINSMTKGVLNFAQTLTFKDKNPVVNLVDKVYSTGVKLTTLAMAELETQIHRLPNLKKWFVEIFLRG